jgi:hypothetical protein
MHQWEPYPMGLCELPISGERAQTIKDVKFILLFEVI